MPKGKAGGKKAADGLSSRVLKSSDEILSENNTSPALLLPIVDEESAVLVHRQVLLLEFNSPELLEEVLRATPLVKFVVRKLSGNVLMVDHADQDELVKLLTKKGYEPKIITQ